MTASSCPSFLLKGSKELRKAGNIGVKRMGELKIKPFIDVVTKRNWHNNETEAKEGARLYPMWKDYIKYPQWHPYKVLTLSGKPQVHFFNIYVVDWLYVKLIVFVCLTFIYSLP